jgi:hypothetical protein
MKRKTFEYYLLGGYFFTEDSCMSKDDVRKSFHANDEYISHLEKQSETIKEESQVLRDSYNSLCSDLDNGEHVDMSWVRSSIDNAANDRLVTAFNRKVSHLEKQNENLVEAIKIIKAIRVSDRVDIRQALYEEAQEFLEKIKGMK